MEPKTINSALSIARHKLHKLHLHLTTRLQHFLTRCFHQLWCVVRPSSSPAWRCDRLLLVRDLSESKHLAWNTPRLYLESLDLSACLTLLVSLMTPMSLLFADGARPNWPTDVSPCWLPLVSLLVNNLRISPYSAETFQAQQSTSFSRLALDSGSLLFSSLESVKRTVSLSAGRTLLITSTVWSLTTTSATSGTYRLSEESFDSLFCWSKCDYNFDLINDFVYRFDPLGLCPTDADELYELKTKELNNGRLAMISVAGFVAQEFVNNTEIFQHLFKTLEADVGL